MKQEDRQYIESLTDKEIVDAILNRDAVITRLYFYEKCYPLFKACYDKYYTDCETCVEFINQIYLLIMTPRKNTGEAPLQAFGFRCTLTMWLKIIAENYCKQLFKVKIDFFKKKQLTMHSQTSILIKCARECICFLCADI